LYENGVSIDKVKCLDCALGNKDQCTIAFLLNIDED